MTRRNLFDKVHAWLIEPLPADVRRSVEKLAAAEDVQHVAIMPDVHLAADVCVGAVVATSRLLYPVAVGGDIGCGLAAMAFHAEAGLLRDAQKAAAILGALYRLVPANRHAPANMPAALPKELQDAPLSDTRLEREKQRDGRVQFATLGRGNHFLEFQADQEGRLWLLIHSGSRAMGQKITAHHLCQATATSQGLPYLDADSPAGRAYLSDVDWAIRYASQNRLAMMAAVEIMLRERFGIEADRATLIHSDHNHVRWEGHGGQRYLVHRKGAQSAAAGEPGIVPGSMGTASFHVIGRGCAEALCSSSHGAGRKLSRTDARRRIGRRQFERDLRHVWFDHRRAEALREEAPAAYKDIQAVMRAQTDLVQIVRQLSPVLSYKGC